MKAVPATLPSPELGKGKPMASFPGMVIFSLVLFESLGLRVTSDKLLKMEGEKGSSENKSLPHGTSSQSC